MRDDMPKPAGAESVPLTPSTNGAAVPKRASPPKTVQAVWNDTEPDSPNTAIRKTLNLPVANNNNTSSSAAQIMPGFIGAGGYVMTGSENNRGDRKVMGQSSNDSRTSPGFVGLKRSSSGCEGGADNSVHTSQTMQHRHHQHLLAKGPKTQANSQLGQHSVRSSQPQQLVVSSNMGFSDGNIIGANVSSNSSYGSGVLPRQKQQKEAPASGDRVGRPSPQLLSISSMTTTSVISTVTTGNNSAMGGSVNTSSSVLTGINPLDNSSMQSQLKQLSISSSQQPGGETSDHNQVCYTV